MQQAIQGFRLSPLQSRLWLLQQHSSAYRAYCSIEITGPLRVASLYHSLLDVCTRHETFRTHFYSVPGMTLPLQVIDDHPALTWSICDLRNVVLDEGTQLVKKLLRSTMEESVGVREGPLLHCSLLILAEQHYIFGLSLPSLLADRHTLQLFFRELVQAYEHEQTGVPLINEELLQYLQFSEWQYSLQEKNDIPQDKNFGDQQELVALDHLHLSDTDKTFVPFEPMQYAVSLDRELWFEVQSWLEQHTYALPVLLLGCWAALLGRLNEHQLPQLAMQIDGRGYAELADVAGLLEKTLPLACQMDTSTPFMDFLAMMQQSYEQLLSHYPTFSWQKLLTKDQFEAGIALSSYSFAYGESPSPCPVGDVTFCLHEAVCYSEPFALRLVAVSHADELHLEWHYDTSAFSALQVENLTESFLTLLRGAMHHPQRRLELLPLLTDAQQEWLIREAHGPSLPLPSEGVHQLFEEQARLHPERLAVQSPVLCLRYEQLNAQANQLARHLLTLGVGPNVLVGLCLERSALALVGVLGVLKAGGAYVPLDGEQPRERLGQLLQESQVSVLVTSSSLRSHLPAFEGVVLLLDEAEPALARLSTEDLSPRSHGEDLAYVLYTSGSTGRPKGVLVRQRSLLNYTLGLLEHLPREDGLHFATVSTLAADLGNSAIYGALVSGGCVDVLDAQTVTSASALTDWVREHPLDVLKIVPSHLGALLWTEQGRDVLPKRLLILGGEAASARVLRRVWEQGSGCAVLNHYGPTEATVGALVQPLEPGEEHCALGRPLANTEAYVLNAQMQLVPVGCRGEICLGGEGIALGYLSDGGQTAERFVPHPWSQEPGRRLYRTGDVGWMNARGEIAFVGRTDQQVKVRGYRVELAEVERVLGQHLDVSECKVLLHDNTMDDPILIGYIVARKLQNPPDKKALREFVRMHLPEYMVPASIVFLPFIPLTSNGKVDIHQLHEIDQMLEEGNVDAAQNEVKAIVLPRDVVELQLLRIWEEVLQIPNISVIDDFFDLGGHSMLALRLLALIFKEFDQDLTLANFFLNPTIADLAVVLRQGNASAYQSAVVALQPLGSRPPFFCIHPSGGTVTNYIYLARYLGQNQPFYGLQAPDQNDAEDTLATIEDLAAYYRDAIRKLQPQGPYLLGGWSMGGIIALEIAQQLIREGDQVAMLALIDSRIASEEGRTLALAQAAELSDEALARMLAATFKLELPPDFAELDPSEVANQLFIQAKDQQSLPADTNLEQVRRIARASRKHARIARIYRPQVYEQHIDYFIAQDSIGQGGDMEEEDQPTMPAEPGGVLRPWYELARGGLELHIIPGTHRLMVEEPYVQVLAQSLYESIDKACQLGKGF